MLTPNPSLPCASAQVLQAMVHPSLLELYWCVYRYPYQVATGTIVSRIKTVAGHTQHQEWFICVASFPQGGSTPPQP